MAIYPAVRPHPGALAGLAVLIVLGGALLLFGALRRGDVVSYAFAVLYLLAAPFWVMTSLAKYVEVDSERITVHRVLDSDPCGCFSIPTIRAQYLGHPESCCVLRACTVGCPMTCSDNVVISQTDSYCDKAIVVTLEQPQSFQAEVRQLQHALESGAIQAGGPINRGNGPQNGNAYPTQNTYPPPMAVARPIYHNGGPDPNVYPPPTAGSSPYAPQGPPQGLPGGYSPQQGYPAAAPPPGQQMGPVSSPEPTYPSPAAQPSRPHGQGPLPPIRSNNGSTRQASGRYPTPPPSYDDAVRR
eukprot:TRINITY_DN23964_c0_g1_i1.p1 TRINITY_DN23964_c0_g1~~TRINITY_DN23964_c0_g1_i1.p1  ORF type:complete len:322 (-),score=28.44 TRINITY_DN23964_c0_g1_i1:441-1337(-)